MLTELYGLCSPVGKLGGHSGMRLSLVCDCMVLACVVVTVARRGMSQLSATCFGMFSGHSGIRSEPCLCCDRVLEVQWIVEGEEFKVGSHCYPRPVSPLLVRRIAFVKLARGGEQRLPVWESVRFEFSRTLCNHLHWTLPGRLGSNKLCARILLTLFSSGVRWN